MDYLYLSILSLVQGITEFIPISSSAHLILIPYMMNVKDQGVLVDIAAHVGSLLAVVFVNRFLLWNILKSILGIKKDKDNTKMFVNISISFIPIVIVGLLIHFYKPTFLRSPHIIIYTSIIFGILLYFADKIGKKNKTEENITYKTSIFAGVMQAIAVIPGVSRSGATMTGLLLTGQKRQDAVKFSFLMSIPTIALAGLDGLLKVSTGMGSIKFEYALFTIVMSFIFSIIAIRFMLNWVKAGSFKIFAIYRILLGIFLYFYIF